MSFIMYILHSKNVISMKKTKIWMLTAILSICGYGLLLSSCSNWVPGTYFTWGGYCVGYLALK